MNKFQMVAMLCDARDTLKALYPDTFCEKVAEIQGMIKSAMTMTGREELATAIDMAKVADSSVMQMWILAAVVEMLEPSGQCAES